MIYTIFLDIDGVLNSLDNQRSLESYMHAYLYNVETSRYNALNAKALKYSLKGHGNYKFDERCKRHFNNVCRLIMSVDTEAKIQIVLTSAWQYMGIDKFRKIWEDEQMLGDVIDFINNYNPERGSGILKYLEKYNITNNWASLDDDALTYRERIELDDRYRIVMPNSIYGISYNDSKALLYALTNKQYNNFINSKI